MSQFSPADVIRKLLIDNGEEEGDVFVSLLPDDPDEAICVYDTPGTSDGRLMATGEQIEHKGIQVRVRGKDYPTAWRWANDLAELLDAQKKTIVAMDPPLYYVVHNVSRRGAILPAGIESEDRRRHEFTINAVTTLEESE